MIETRVSTKNIVQGQVPLFMQEEYPLFGPLLKQYYESQDHFSSPVTIVKNIDQLLKVGTYTSDVILSGFTTTTQFVDYSDDRIYVKSTSGWPSRYGLLKINDEIITYTSLGSTSFEGCIRGFSGITTYNFYGKQVSYETTTNQSHELGSKVENLSTLFLKTFFTKLKKQYLPGFEDIELNSGLNQANFLLQSKDFYSTKGTSKSNNILFKSIFGENAETIKPQEYLIKPSNNDYRLVRQIVVSPVNGNPFYLSGKTLYQKITKESGITSSFGSISDVEPVFNSVGNYYQFDIDFGYDRDTRVFGSIYGNFEIHPKTKVVGIANTSTLIVDSTVGFSKSGTFILNDSEISYTDKTINQFLNCSELSSISIGDDVVSSSHETYGFDENGNRIDLRVTGVIEKLNITPKLGNYYEKDDNILVKNLGVIKENSDLHFNSWKFNTPTKFNAKSIAYNGQYFVITTFDDHMLSIGDDLEFVNNIDNSSISGRVEKLLSNYKFQASANLDQSESSLESKYFIRRKIKLSNTNIPYTSDIQNIYDYEGDAIVTSPSLPSYNIESQNRSKTITISGFTTTTDLSIPNHNFYSGDIVKITASSDIFSDKIKNYFVKKIDNNTIRLSVSNSNISNGIFEEFSNYLEQNASVSLVPLNNSGKELTTQKLVRKISKPEDVKGEPIKTVPDSKIGVLINGVELLNYKAKEVVYCGPIESIDVLSGGEDYDIINPPILRIEDSTGIGATGTCAVKGSLKSIEIIDGGFDYVEIPNISISGGNGTGAKAEVKLSKIYHDVYFNALGVSTSSGGFISTSTNIIGFNTEHKFNIGESVIYSTFGGTKIGIGSTTGDISTKSYLQDGSIYYISIVDKKSIKLHNNEKDAIGSLNEINITTLGQGTQRFRSTRRKNVVSSIKIINSGEGYENKKRIINSSGINTANDTINIKNHDYKSGELITYQCTGSSISGLDTSRNYYVMALDKDNFRLALSGIGSFPDQNYLTNQYVRLKSSGSGTHIFNYPEINVSIKGKIGIGGTDSESFNASIVPKFRGEITSIQVTNGGSGYGSTDVINFDKQPIFTLNSGKDAVIKPIIVGDKINSVIVLNSGQDYNTLPTFNFEGSGSYAKLTPVIESGKLVSVKVINGGIGFSTETSNIIVESSGKGVLLNANIKKWTVNTVEKYKNVFAETSDDGLLIPGIYDGLQYVNLFAPRNLRKNLLSKNNDGTLNYTKNDLLFNNYEILSTNHSPIIGWSYDGHPIYGPYGYSNSSGGTIKALSSGYELKLSPDRPSAFDPGFFVEDFVFTNSGDLDEHNGRFCKTPDYPEGVYAYFCTINTQVNGYDSKYGNFRRPVFPYVIGDTYKSNPIKFNYLKSSNQDDIDFNNEDYLRNTYSYKLNATESAYEGFIEPYKFIDQITKVNSSSIGSIDSVGIVSFGYGYKVGDSVVFNNENTGGNGATARVNEIFEERIVSIESNSKTVDDITLRVLTQTGLVEGISTTPHGLKNLDIINISAVSSESFSKLGGFYEIEVADKKFTLSSGIGTTGSTGITTYLNFINSVNEDLIKQDDILKITKAGVGTERFLVLSVDPVFNRVKVKREYEGTVGYSHSIFSVAEEDPKTFRYNSGFSTTAVTKVQRKIFFEPSSSVAIGTVGSGTTIFYSTGSNTISKFIDLGSIYIPNHKLITGQKLIYSNEGNTSLSISNTGIGSTTLSNNSTLYAAKINEDLIGISTLPIGIGSTGGFSGIGTQSNLLYFISYGTGNFHSFKTQEEEIRANAEKNVATLVCKQDHNLEENNQIKIEILPGISTTIVVKYNSENRRMVLNPKSFNGSGINTTSNIITIFDHGYETGNKLIYTSSNPATGLVSNNIYYVVKIDKDSFKLTESLYQTAISNPQYVSIASTGGNHELSEVNPPITVTAGYTLDFDLSDSSLSDLNGSVKVQAFDFDLYDSSLFTNKFITSLKSNEFEVSKKGIVGVTNDAKLTIKLLDTVPRKLYYKLNPLIGKSYLSKEKSEIIIDKDIFDHNSINIVESKYNGTYSISGVGSTTISFNLNSFPEAQRYDQYNSKIKYISKENNSIGSINKVEIIFGGNGYKSNPGVSSVTSLNGSRSILNTNSSKIGNILKSTVQNIGFEYPSDKTLRPTAQPPQKLYIEQLYTIDNIGIISGGKNYVSPPSFVVIDSISKEIKSEVYLESLLSGNKISEVKVLKNTKTLFGIPKIVPVNNTNGIGITNIAFNATNKTVTVNLASGFSTSKDFPFSIGSKIFIEGVGIVSTGNGYNSSEYNYELFTLTGVTSAIGGSTGTLTYKLDGDINPGEFSKESSIQNSTNSFARIIPESYLPVFDPKISYGESKYNVGEEVYVNERKIGVITKWDPTFKLLKINNHSNKVQEGQIIRGGATDNRSVVVKSYDSYADFKVGSYNEKLKDYSGNSGNLNEFLQVLQDGDYYQNFSYSIKSRVPIHKWDKKVDELTHTLGFKKFSDLQIESGISTSTINVLTSDADVLIDLIEEKDFDCYEDYAFAKETTKTFNNSLISDQIYFDYLRLLDYTEFVSNRVLKIDDISVDFDDTPSIFNYCVVGTFDITKYSAAQFYLLIKDARYFGEKEIIIVNVIYDGANGYLTAYGRNETVLDLGSFSFRRSGNRGEILFYPTKYEYNSYNIANINVSIANGGISGIGSTSLGDVVSFASTAVSISSSPSPVENTIISIPTSSFSSAKILICASSGDTNIQFSEVNVTSNGSEAYYDIFGDIDSGDSSSGFGSGIVGQVGITTTANNVLVTFKPNENLSADIRGLTTLIGNTSTTGIGTIVLYKGELSSHYTSIASTSLPIETNIAGFSTDGVTTHEGALYYIQIHDTTNNQIQFSEVVLTVDSDYNPQVSEYASIYSNNSLGEIGAAKSTSDCYLTFKPNENIDTQVRVFQKTLQISPKQDNKEIDLQSALIRSDVISLKFEGTQISTKRDFNLTHRGSSIFRKVVDGSSNSAVDTTNDTVFIPNHFFVTGEKIDYQTEGSRIGIATTTISGIGTTSLLPSSLYVVKINDNLVKFAETPEKALKRIPEVLNITSVGVGNSHTFSSNYKSNSKSLICIDNIIQNPLVATARTTFVSFDTDDVNSNSIIIFNNTDGFYAKDLIKIDNEFLLITDIGIGGTNRVACRREQLGTVSAIHVAGSIITKYDGNYNIVDDMIYFVESPHGGEDNRYSSFQGRIFLRSQTVGSSNTAYYQNNIFDDISNQFNGISDKFTLKVNGENVSGIVSSNSVSAGILLINNVFQKPKYPATGIAQTYTYEVIENSGISSIVFSGNPVGLTTNGIIGPMKFDTNSSSLPRGGIIVSVGSTQGYGFQPLVAAGGTSIVSIAGTIQSVSIGNSGSGYRSGIQTSINVSAITSNGKINIGTARALDGNIISVAVTYVGSGFTSTNPPLIVIDSPLNYENIPLVYDSSNAGIGTEATVDIVVGYGNSVIDFNISNSGYGYSVGNILTFKVGGTTGIPTITSLPYRPFQLKIEETFNDKFNAWYPGQFVVLDDINNQFDGSRKIFTLKENGVIANFVSKRGSPIDLKQNLLVFINDILQIPDDSYIFNGGSQIQFLEAPKSGDGVKILFFKGSDSDVLDVDIAPSIKVGDRVKLTDQLSGLKNIYTQDQRVVSELQTVDTVHTVPYYGPGITSDSSIIRTIEWCKQKEDFYLDEILISKSREELNSNIFPVANIIRPIGVGSTSIFVNNSTILFNYYPEVLPFAKQTLNIISQEEKTVAIATAIVSIAGTISNVIVTNGGTGYSNSPSITISKSQTNSSAIATCTVSGLGSISSINITSSGFGYTSSNPPQILISQDPVKIETIRNAKYEGDFGIITGIGTTSVSGIYTAITFDFYIPKDSVLRNSDEVGTALTCSGIQTGYYFAVYDSIIGTGVTSINDDESIIGIGTSYLDNVYQVFDVKNRFGDAVGVGSTTDIVRVTARVSSYNNLTGIGNSQFFGFFSWGRIYDFDRSSLPKDFPLSITNGISGLSTSPLIVRANPMRSLYTS